MDSIFVYLTIKVSRILIMKSADDGDLNTFRFTSAKKTFTYRVLILYILVPI